MKHEAPCAVDGGRCVWMSEWEGEEGESAWYLFCVNCGRTHDDLLDMNDAWWERAREWFERAASPPA